METSRKICRVYCQGIITVRQVLYWFTNICYSDYYYAVIIMSCWLLLCYFVVICYIFVMVDYYYLIQSLILNGFPTTVALWQTKPSLINHLYSDILVSSQKFQHPTGRTCFSEEKRLGLGLKLTPDDWGVQKLEVRRKMGFHVRVRGSMLWHWVKTTSLDGRWVNSREQKLSSDFKDKAPVIHEK